MNRRIILTAVAEAQLDSIARWYHLREANLSARFRAEVYEMLRRIAQFPSAYMRFRYSVRRALMDRFRYYIYFAFDAQRVVVLAIVHQRRADSMWLDRKDASTEVTND